MSALVWKLFVSSTGDGGTLFPWFLTLMNCYKFAIFQRALTSAFRQCWGGTLYARLTFCKVYSQHCGWFPWENILFKELLSQHNTKNHLWRCKRQGKLSMMFTQAQCQGLPFLFPKRVGRRVFLCEERHTKNIHVVIGLGKSKLFQRGYAHTLPEPKSVLWDQTGIDINEGGKEGA